MPFDTTNFAPTRILTPTEQLDLEILQKARDGVASKGGWCQNVLNGESGRSHCALGWLFFYAADEKTAADIVANRLSPVLPHSRASRDRPEPKVYVVRFNDSSRTRKADVVTLFDRAIARLQQI